MTPIRVVRSTLAATLGRTARDALSPTQSHHRSHTPPPSPAHKRGAPSGGRPFLQPFTRRHLNKPPEGPPEPGLKRTMSYRSRGGSHGRAVSITTVPRVGRGVLGGGHARGSRLDQGRPTRQAPVAETSRRGRPTTADVQHNGPRPSHLVRGRSHAVGVGFEPTVTRATTVFKTVPLGRSGNPPAPRPTWAGAGTDYRARALGAAADQHDPLPVSCRRRKPHRTAPPAPTTEQDSSGMLHRGPVPLLPQLSQSALFQPVRFNYIMIDDKIVTDFPPAEYGDSDWAKPAP